MGGVCGAWRAWRAPCPWARTSRSRSSGSGASGSAKRFAILSAAAAAAVPSAPRIPPAAFYAAFNRVKDPSIIRVEADELQYPLHIVLRYKIEKGVVDGDLDVHDIPARWNELSQQLLGVVPTSDKVGCLQDMHW